MAERLRFMSFLVLSLSCLLVPLMAQTQQGDILGTIVDAQGGVVPGADIKIINEATGAVRTAVSDDRGDYLAAGFFPGTYRLEVVMPGFQKAVVPEIKVDAQARMRVNVTLQIGEITTEVTVTAPMIRTEGSTVNITVPRLIFDKPLTTSDASGSGMQVAMWFPGSSATTGSMWGGVSRRDRHNEWQLEGTQTAGINIGAHSIEEISVVMGSPSAEYGRAVTTNMTQKSGTNKLHGGFYPSFVNQGINAVNNVSGAQKRPVGITNWRFEGNIGGPVYIPKLYDGRNKTFFFYDQYSIKPAKTVGTYLVSVPTQRMLGGDFSRYTDSKGALITIKDPLTGSPFAGNVIPSSRISSVAKAINQQVIVDNFGLPLTYVGGPDNLVNNGLYPNIGEQKFWMSVLKLDHNFGTKHVLSGSYNWGDRFFYKCGIGVPGFNRMSDLPHTNWTGAHTWIITPKIVSQLRISFYRYHESQWVPRSFTDRSRVPGKEFVDKWGIQGISDNGLSGAPKMGGPGFGGLGIPGVDIFLNHNVQEFFVRDHRTQIYENISYTTGRHTVKGGFLVVNHSEKRSDNREEAFGRFAFDGRFTGVPYADFLLGIPAVSARTQSRPPTFNKIREDGFYLQDDWRVSPRLTLNVGFRWDRYTAPYDDNGMYFNFDPASGKMVVPDQSALDKVSKLWPQATLPVVLASSLGYPEKLTKPTARWLPRASLAYRPLGGSDFVVRAGFGVYNSLFRFDGLQTAGPFALAELINNQLDPVTGGGFTPRYSFPNPFGSAAGVASGVATGSSIAKDLRPEYVATWNVTAEKSLYRDSVLRVTYLGNKGTQLIHTFDMNTPLVSNQPFSQSRRPYPAYQSITRMENGEDSRYNSMQINVTSPWQDIVYLDFAYILQRGYQNYTSYAWDRRRDKGRDNNWPLHDVLVNYYFETPFGPQKRWLTNPSGPKWLLARIVGGWSATGTFSWHSGQLSTPTFSGYDSGNINQFSGRPDLVPGCDLYTKPKKYVNGMSYVNVGCFKAPAPGTLGNAPVNLLEGPGQWVLNMSPFKEFRLPYWEGSKLIIGASIYNVLNSSAYWATVNGGIGTYSKQADGSYLLRPPSTLLNLGSTWVRRVGTEGTGQRKWWFQAKLTF